jgi:molybdopterin-guanine dinucleotide biosynthesis protein A
MRRGSRLRDSKDGIALSPRREEGSDVTSQRVAGVVLAGGGSRRMGRSKSELPFGPGTLLDWMIALLRDAVDDLWISVARPEDAPAASSLPFVRGVLVDTHPGQGPLAALAIALAALERPILFVACDLPFLSPDDLRLLAGSVDRLGAVDGITSRGEGRGRSQAILLADDRGPQPLAGLYDPALRAHIDARLAAGERAMHELLAGIRYETVAARARVPGCPPLANLNAPRDYESSVRMAIAAGLIRLARILP